MFLPGAMTQILGKGGAVSRRLGDLYEYRPQQLEMASAVQQAIEQGHHLMVEAGTGVGKSFAYLLPAIEAAVKQKKRVVISTHTISLQEQLVDKDIPLIRSVYPDEFTAVLVKGRSNYLCQRRLSQARARQGMLFDQPAQLRSLLAVEEWSAKTTDGSLADLPALPDPSVWERVCAEHGNCLGKKCKFYADCFWQSAKRRMNTGQILVVNHALFFSDLALRIAGVNYLPKYDVVILDEAHTVEDVATSHFGLSVSENRIKSQLNTLYDPKRGKGLLSTQGSCANDSILDIVAIHKHLDGFFERCLEWQKDHGRSNGRVLEPSMVENDITPRLTGLSHHLKEMLSKIKNEGELSELNAMAEKINLLGQEIDAVVSQKMPDAVYWLHTGGRTRRNVSLHAAPVNVAEGLKTHLFEKISSVVMCSATMCAAEENSSFDYMISRLGAQGARTLALGSPFDYAAQATLYIESDLPEPNDPVHFPPAACERILHYLKLTSGGAFVLFTSYSALRDAAERLKDSLKDLGYPLFVQGQGVSRKTLLDNFRASKNAVLFGTASFWQGIDVRGDALRNVIIVKLPFAVPDEPIIEARLEAITRSGGNAFLEYSVPEAIIKLKQGFGRLIRSRTDKGIVVILDSRIKTKRYGKRFLQALPPCTVITNERNAAQS